MKVNENAPKLAALSNELLEKYFDTTNSHIPVVP